MELKVWVNSVQRVVCGVTPSTTCQDVVIALAQAMGRTGRFSLVERFRGTERPLAATDSPVEVLQKWGEYAPELKFVLRESSAKKKKKSVKEPANDAAVALRSGHRTTSATAIKTVPKTMRVGSGSAIKKSLSFSGASFTPSGGLAAFRTRQQAKKLSSSSENKFAADPANIDEEPTFEHDLSEAATPVNGGVHTGAQAGEANASHMTAQPTSALRQQMQPAAAPRPSMLRQASITDAASTRAAEVPRPPAPPQRRTSRSSSLCGSKPPCGGDVSPDRLHQSSGHANGPVAAAAPGQPCQQESEASSNDRRLPRQSSRRSDGDSRPRSKLPKAGEPTASSASETTAMSSPAAKAASAAGSGADGSSQAAASASQQPGTSSSSSSSTIAGSSGSGKASSSAVHSSLFRAVTEELKGHQRSSQLPRPTVLAGSSSSSAGNGSNIAATNLSSSSAATIMEPRATSAVTGTVADPTVPASQASRSIPQPASSTMAVAVAAAEAAAAVTLPSASSHAAVQDMIAGRTAADDRKPDAARLKHSAEERSRQSSVAAGTRLRSPGTSETVVLSTAGQSVGATSGDTERRASVRPAGALSSLNSAGSELTEEKVQTPLAETRNAKKENDASRSSEGLDQSEEYQRAINVVTLQERTLALQQSRLELLDKELVASQQKDRIRAEEASAVRRLVSELEATCRCRDRELEQYGDRSSSLLLDSSVGDGSPPSDCHPPSAELEALRLDGERIRAEAAAERERLAECERSLAEHLQLVDQLSAHVAACREQLARLTSAKAEAAGATAPATDGSDRSDDRRGGDDEDDDAEYQRLKDLCDEERAALDRLEAECAHASDDLRRAEAAVLAKRRAVETVELELRAAGSTARTPAAAAASAAGPGREASRASVAATAGGGGGDAAVGGSGGSAVRSDADASSGLVVRAVAAKTAVAGVLPSAPLSAGFRGGAAASGPVSKRPTTTTAKGGGRVDATYCH